MPSWLDVALGRAESPVPPPIDSERIKGLVGRALLAPKSLSAAEVQELAASVLDHLVSMKGMIEQTAA